MMTKKRLVTALLATALVAVPALPLAGAQEEGGPQAREQADKLVLANDHVTVWFHGKKPFLKVFPADAEENESTGFSIKFHRVVEFNDKDEDGAPDENEIVAFLNLEPANGWDVQIVDEEDSARINLTLTGGVKVRGPAKGLDVDVPTRDANVTLVFHVFKGETTLQTGTGENVTVPAGHVKYDFIVSEWPWLNAQENHVALDLLTSATVREPVNGTGLATVESNGTAVGAVTWATTAEAVNAAGEDVVTNVTASVLSYENETEENEDGENLTRLAFAYDETGFQSLVHDPTIGVASTPGAGDEVTGEIADRLRDVPATGALAALAVVGVAALVAARGRRSG